MIWKEDLESCSLLSRFLKMLSRLCKKWWMSAEWVKLEILSYFSWIRKFILIYQICLKWSLWSLILVVMPQSRNTSTNINISTKKTPKPLIVSQKRKSQLMKLKQNLQAIILLLVIPRGLKTRNKNKIKNQSLRSWTITSATMVMTPTALKLLLQTLYKRTAIIR